MTKVHTLSLVHNVRRPEVEQDGRPPLLLLLHGIGSNEDDLFSLAPYLDGRLLLVSARAPLVLGPGAFGWFNIEFTPQGIVADLDEARQSYLTLLGFTGELLETYGADPARLYLLGFSQGAMMSLSVALTRPDRVAGVAALSGRLPAHLLPEVNAETLRGMPVFVAHGLYDPVIPVEWGRAAREALASLPVELTYREYPMGHEVTMESLGDATAWLSATLDRQAGAREGG